MIYVALLMALVYVAAYCATSAKAAALQAIRTGRHDTYDRLVFDFTGKVGKVTVRYVPVVRADPSDLSVPLPSNAYLEVTIQHAHAHAHARFGWPEPGLRRPE